MYKRQDKKAALEKAVSYLKATWFDDISVKLRYYSRKFEMNHRTLVKPSKGLRPGEVTKLTVFPYGYSNFQTREEVNELAMPVLNRRSTLDYEDFGVFKSKIRLKRFKYCPEV